MKRLLTIVGMQYRGTEKLVRELPAGERLILRRDPGNPADVNAIAVIVMVGMFEQLVGYIKATEAAEIAPTMDAAEKTQGLGKFVPGNWPQVEIVVRPS